MASIGVWDYVIIGIVLVISSSMGIYYRLTGGKQKTTKEFLLANRSMGITPVAFSLMTSFMSAITILGVSMENYSYGTMFVLINFAYALTTPIVVYLIIPVFYRLKTASVYEYLEMRFGFPTRLFASIAFSVQIVLYMGIVLYAPALALEAVTGLDQVFSIVVIGAVCTFYSTIGGMKAVLVTDIFQSLLMFVSVFSVIICAGIVAGNLGDIWTAAQEGGRIYFTDISIDPTRRHTWWTQLIGGGATYLCTYGVNQVQVQRMLSVRNLKSSQAAMWWCLPILMLLSISTCFSGLCIYYYYRNCDPLLDGRINSRDQLMPLFVVDTMSHIPGLSGLFIAGIFSASLSTISSAISSLAAVTIEDYLKPLYKHVKKREAADSKTAWYSKILSIIYGAMCIGIAFLAGSLGGVLQAALSIFGIIGGPLLGLFMLGMCIKSANQKGAITSLALALAFCFWIGFGQPKPPIPSLDFSTEGCPVKAITTSHVLEVFAAAATKQTEDQDYFYLYRISYMWYSVLGFLISFVLGIVFSWVYATFGLDSNSRIYNDAAGTVIKYELFVPPVARRLRRQQMPVVVVTSTSSEYGSSGNGVGGIHLSSAPRNENTEDQLSRSCTNATELCDYPLNQNQEKTNGEIVGETGKSAVETSRDANIT